MREITKEYYDEKVTEILNEVESIVGDSEEDNAFMMGLTISLVFRELRIRLFNDKPTDEYQ